MDEDTAREDTAPGRNGNLSRYTLDTYTMEMMGRHRVRLIMPYLGLPPYVLPSPWSLHPYKRVTVLP